MKLKSIRNTRHKKELHSNKLMFRPHQDKIARETFFRYWWIINEIRV